MIQDASFGQAFAPRLDARETSEPSERSYRIALNPLQKAGVLAGLRASGADKRLDRTLGQMTGREFTPQDLGTLKDRALDEIEWPEAKRLQGIAEGPPVDLAREQKAIIDSVMGRLGGDPLAERARAAYGRAIKHGQIRTR
jgi:hypothetical protein